MRVALAIGVAVATVALIPSAHADPANCDTDLLHAAACKNTPGSEVTKSAASTASDARYTYKFVSRCKVGESCTAQERVCRTGDGEVGAWYVLRRLELASGLAQNLGVICLTPAEAPESVVTITPAMVRREFERLAWPASELELQPPDGQTLVNFDTNFFTRNTAPTTRTVTLLGQRVEIEAAPAEYTWDFGDGSSRTTSSPGAAYPDLDVTHAYADPGRVGPSVATTYTGRYRINGGGWQQIPGSLTLQGEPESLRVRAASPRLVGSY